MLYIFRKAFQQLELVHTIVDLLLHECWFSFFLNCRPAQSPHNKRYLLSQQRILAIQTALCLSITLSNAQSEIFLLIHHRSPISKLKFRIHVMGIIILGLRGWVRDLGVTPVIHGSQTSGRQFRVQYRESVLWLCDGHSRVPVYCGRGKNNTIFLATSQYIRLKTNKRKMMTRTLWTQLVVCGWDLCVSSSVVFC